MTPSGSPFENSRPRPVPTVLDALRPRIDHDDFDGAVLSLESVVADLGYGDVRALPGSVAWIDKLRDEGKRIALVYAGDRADAALEIAGIADRFDVVYSGPRTAATIEAVLDAIDVTPDRAVIVDVAPDMIAAAREAGCALTIAIARSSATPAELRRSGATAIVADLQELLGPITGR
jgi:beta-phosphoglucomutase-like phosphatase (HAD superfamily)